MSDPPSSAELLERLPRRVAHAMRTPLGLVVSALRELGANGDDPMLGLGQRGIDQLVHLADRLSLLGRLARGELGPPSQLERDVDLVDVLAQARADVTRTRPRRRVETTTHAPQHVPASGNAELLRAAFGELLDNAVRLARHTVTATLRVEGEHAVLEVCDDGPGPTTTAASEADAGGLGVGLHLARAIVGEHGGTLELRDGPDGGGLARIELASRGS